MRWLAKLALILVALVFVSASVSAAAASLVPNTAFEDDGTNVISAANTSNNVYATLDVNKDNRTDYIQSNWTGFSMQADSIIDSVVYYFEHYESTTTGAVDLRVDWWNGASWTTGVCTPTVIDAEATASCDLSAYINTVSEANSISLRWVLNYPTGSAVPYRYAYMDYENITIVYRPDDPPSVSLNYPANGAVNATTTNIIFGYTPADDRGFRNASLWTNRTGAWAFTTANATVLTNGSVNTVTYNFGADGVFLWNIQVCDNRSTPQCVFASANRTLTITLPDAAKPLWQSQGSNVSTVDEGQPILLYAQGKDETALNYAVLSTNESGVWVNHSGVYGSPMSMGNTVNTWTWSNFTWRNSSFFGDVAWMIWYNDTYNNRNSTSTMAFAITPSKNRTNLVIFDASDSQPVYVNNQMKFYANYTNATSGAPVTSALCNVTFNISGSWTAPVAMAYNATSMLYEYNRSFSSAGTYNWNVSCSRAGYYSNAANSTFVISTSTPASVRTSKGIYSSCISNVYYKVTREGTTNYTVYVKSEDNVIKDMSAGISTDVYFSSYNLTSVSPVGFWTVDAQDETWRAGANASFEVKARTESDPATILTDSYISLMKTSSSRMNLYAPASATSCNFSARNAAGALVHSRNINITAGGVYSASMSELGGGAWSYPLMVFLKCNTTIVPTNGPATEGLTVFQTASQLNSKLYGVIEQAGDVVIGAPDKSLSYKVTVLTSGGSVQSIYTGTIPMNGTAMINYASAKGITVELNGTGLAHYEPKGEKATMYTSSNLIENGLSLFNDRSGTNIDLFSPLGPANVTLYLYPNFGYIPSIGVCVKSLSLTSNQTLSQDIFGMILDCKMRSTFGSVPVGTMLINATRPIVIGSRSWAGAELDSPVYKSTNLYKRGYFVSNDTSMNYVIYMPSPYTYVYVNGVDANSTSEHSTVAGTVDVPYLNISSDKPIAVSTSVGQANTMIIVSG